MNNLGGDSTAVSISTNDGNKESLECSGRGMCQEDTGKCFCYGLQYAGTWDDGVTACTAESCWYNYSSSDGKGLVSAALVPGDMGNCGYYDVTKAPNDCPVSEITNLVTAVIGNASCSGHGTCDSSTKKCTCYDGWTQGNCAKRTCPTGVAWYDEAYATDTAHRKGAECSNKGHCDRLTGQCLCQPGWGGEACQRMNCIGLPADISKPCNGNGMCKSMAQMAALATNNGVSTPFTYGATVNKAGTWDADMIYGCYCDAGYYFEPNRNHSVDFVCSSRPCPYGDNPSTRQSDTTMMQGQSWVPNLPEVRTVSI
jgi:hypothetical protein